jgi:hypothetical protein
MNMKLLVVLVAATLVTNFGLTQDPSKTRRAATLADDSVHMHHDTVIAESSGLTVSPWERSTDEVHNTNAVHDAKGDAFLTKPTLSLKKGNQTFVLDHRGHAEKRMPLERRGHDLFQQGPVTTRDEDTQRNERATRVVTNITRTVKVKNIQGVTNANYTADSKLYCKHDSQ